MRPVKPEHDNYSDLYAQNRIQKPGTGTGDSELGKGSLLYKQRHGQAPKPEFVEPTTEEIAAQETARAERAEEAAEAMQRGRELHHDQFEQLTGRPHDQPYQRPPYAWERMD